MQNKLKEDFKICHPQNCWYSENFIKKNKSKYILELK